MNLLENKTDFTSRLQLREIVLDMNTILDIM